MGSPLGPIILCNVGRVLVISINFHCEQTTDSAVFLHTASNSTSLPFIFAKDLILPRR